MTISIRFSQDVEERLERLAKETGRTKTFFIRQMVEDNIDTAEDFYLAESVLERIRAGREKVHTSSFVRDQLGLAD